MTWPYYQWHKGQHWQFGDGFSVIPPAAGGGTPGSTGFVLAGAGANNADAGDVR